MGTAGPRWPLEEAAMHPNMRENRAVRGAPDPVQAAPSGAPEGEIERRASRADQIRERTLQDPQMLAFLDQARLIREGQHHDWTTFDELDKQYPAEA